MGDYNDFWFVNTRVQTTNLKRWFLWGILLFTFVGVCTAVCVRSFYRPIKTYTNNAKYPQVIVDEAKQTNENGYIKGIVKNDSENEIANQYIEFTFYSKHNVELGKEYIEIGTLKAQESKTYEVKFRYSNVDRFIINTINKDEKNSNEQDIENNSRNHNTLEQAALLGVALVFL